MLIELTLHPWRGWELYLSCSPFKWRSTTHAWSTVSSRGVSIDFGPISIDLIQWW